jgi:hypothetical protein
VSRLRCVASPARSIGWEAISVLLLASFILISGLPYKTTFNRELRISIFPLYSIWPNLRNSHHIAASIGGLTNVLVGADIVATRPLRHYSSRRTIAL